LLLLLVFLVQLATSAFAIQWNGWQRIFNGATGGVDFRWGRGEFQYDYVPYHLPWELKNNLSQSILVRLSLTVEDAQGLHLLFYPVAATQRMRIDPGQTFDVSSEERPSGFRIVRVAIVAISGTDGKPISTTGGSGGSVVWQPPPLIPEALITVTCTGISPWRTAPIPDYGGTVRGGGLIRAGDSATVVASPSPSLVFSGWFERDALVSTSASYTFTVAGPRTLIAHFTPYQGTYNVKINVLPAEAASFVSISGQGNFQAWTNRRVTVKPVNTDWAVNYVVRKRGGVGQLNDLFRLDPSDDGFGFKLLENVEFDVFVARAGNWRDQSGPILVNGDKVEPFKAAFGNGVYVAQALIDSTPKRAALLVSSDYISWEEVAVPELFSPTFVNDHFLSFVSDSGSGGKGGEMRIYSSKDGRTWHRFTIASPVPTATNGQFRNGLLGAPAYFAYGNGRFIAGHSLGTFTSTNGVSWSYKKASWPSASASTSYKVFFCSGQFVAIASDVGYRAGQTKVSTSTDGITWKERLNIPGRIAFSPSNVVSEHGKVYVMRLPDDANRIGSVLSSSDFENWKTELQLPHYDGPSWYNDSEYILAAGNGRVMAVRTALRLHPRSSPNPSDSDPPNFINYYNDGDGTWHRDEAEYIIPVVNPFALDPNDTAYFSEVLFADNAFFVPNISGGNTFRPLDLSDFHARTKPFVLYKISLSSVKGALLLGSK